MIVREIHRQVLSCSICEESVGFSRGAAADPERMFILAEEFTAEHVACDRWAHDPERAKRERGFARRMKRENAKLKAQTKFRCGVFS